MERLLETTGMDRPALEQALTSLVHAGRVERVQTADRVTYRSHELVLGLEDPAGWEASVLYHYTALVNTISRKLQVDQKASLSDYVGGSTYHIDLFRGHPLESEVLGELRRFRERMTALRTRVDAVKAADAGVHERIRVVVYCGQSLVEEGDDHEEG